MSAQPIITAAGILVDQQGRLLFGLRAGWKKAWPNYWDAIGGHVENGETIEEALVRELKEEIGVTAERYELLATVAGVKPELYGEMRCHIFAVTKWNGEPYLACDEHSELGWFNLDELEKLPNLAGSGYPELARLAIRASCA